MDFYYRFLPNGRCEIVCTRCFMTVGTASNAGDIQHVEMSHVCLAKTAPRSPDREPDSPAKPPAVLTPGKHSAPTRFWRNILIFICAALFLYLLPKLLEFVALRHLNPLLSLVVPGDLVGCACLAIFLRRRKAGIALYCLLTAIEACFCLFHLTSVNTLSWITDLVPTLVVGAILLRSRQPGGRLISFS